MKSKELELAAAAAPPFSLVAVTSTHRIPFCTPRLLLLLPRR
ncbi:hypothetical protein RCO48_33710 [Peribacillus frigoritolerans]|nr:hypothetical protein [Peribacillus frigoritolerans]